MKQNLAITPQTFDGITESGGDTGTFNKHKFCGSARMTYAICAFLAMVVQLCMRNGLNYVILHMAKPTIEERSSNSSLYYNNSSSSQCGTLEQNEKVATATSGDLEWTRAQQFTLQGTFFYGYLIMLPIAGLLADKFGSKLLFMHSITGQAVIFLLMPISARFSYSAAVVMRILQGIISGCGQPALYQLFTVWAHPTERTALLSFAFSGYSFGALIILPISSYLCQFGWDVAFYSVGIVSLLFGICLHWLVFSTLEEHPRLSREEYLYLKVTNKPKQTTLPWKAILKSVPIYAFTFTHFFHTYGVIMLTLIFPRYLKEAMGFSLTQVGILSSVPFLGSFVSKAITIASCSAIESSPNLNLTRFKRMVYVLSNFASVSFIVGMILTDCTTRTIVVLLSACLGIATDLAFSGGYWSTLLYVAPLYAGLLSGMANAFATCSGFLAPFVILALVETGTIAEWNVVLATLAISYTLGAIVFGLFGSSRLQSWASNNNNNNDVTN